MKSENSEVGEHSLDRGRRHACITEVKCKPEDSHPVTSSRRRGTQQVKLIDFGMATVNRICKKEAPELDFLQVADTFTFSCLSLSC